MYVDDLAIAAPDVKELDWFEDRLQLRFVTKLMGEISMILGIKVTKDRAKRTVELDQEIYLDKVLNKFEISNLVSNMKNYMQDLAEHHALALKRLMRYLRFTISFVISFGPLKDLMVYSDADYGSDKDNKKSISAIMKGDNQGAIALAKNPYLTERSKHIDIAYHYVRDLVDQRKSSLSYIPTAEMAADGFSKPLPKVLFQRFVRMIGAIEIIHTNQNRFLRVL
ncbi:copia-type reverse transcriptase-like protein [Drepanopeziza brunnea f. sp. 'multigermtubi' MB_m1]|uniref:Copia-type reverse transcriptase-like protein n=1 Tax=Marssonina brunnea f. sp. multigermtubi (strain MB_m1) TaxID=1072389 RepID=K1WSM9_MARBU|nr:copia-type reverse transcriptase-like protein [Drepanopeziza brunnea f. sp. 'multigermtubi' MB_m1]EKD16066.1 copia-type reverse transcriptase-like protein [Drepanopeziza brunnea f. sp. 'multigermtubi' MB_m1]